jgi:hypothetical protein
MRLNPLYANFFLLVGYWPLFMITGMLIALILYKTIRLKFPTHLLCGPNIYDHNDINYARGLTNFVAFGFLIGGLLSLLLTRQFDISFIQSVKVFIAGGLITMLFHVIGKYSSEALTHLIHIWFFHNMKRPRLKPIEKPA